MNRSLAPIAPLWAPRERFDKCNGICHAPTAKSDYIEQVIRPTLQFRIQELAAEVRIAQSPVAPSY
jgi:hypothetical protein